MTAAQKPYDLIDSFRRCLNQHFKKAELMGAYRFWREKGEFTTDISSVIVDDWSKF